MKLGKTGRTGRAFAYPAVAALAGLSLVVSASPALAAAPAGGAPASVSASGNGIQAAAAKGQVARILKVKAAPGAKPGQLKVVWKAKGKPQKFWVVCSYLSDGLYPDRMSSKHRWRTKAVAGNKSSITFSIPKKFRPLVGAGTGNPVYVKVYAYGGGKTTKSGNSTAGWVRAPKVVGTSAQKVRFATYNVQGAFPSGGVEKPWDSRRMAVRNAIVKANPDILAVQEANLAKVSNGLRQVDDIAAFLKPYGYVLAYPSSSIGATAGTTSTKESHLFYKSSTITRINGAIQSMRAVNPGQSIPHDKYFAWGIFKSKASGVTFVASSIHLDAGASKAMNSMRAKAIVGVQSYVRGKAAGKPAVLMGDFNSDTRHFTNGPDVQMVKRGWLNAASTLKQYNFKYGSSNQGYPAKPIVNSIGMVGTRIDNIMMLKTGGSYAYNNQVILKGGRFVEAYRGSDHNLQSAIISIR